MFIITNQSPLINLTLLHIAAELGNSKVAGFLIERGADLNQKDNNGNSPLCLAAKNDYKETVEALIKNDKNLQPIYNHYKDHNNSIIRLLSNQKVVEGMKSMQDKQLTILCKHINKCNDEDIQELLSSKEIVDNINNLDDDAFEGILNEGKLEVLGVKGDNDVFTNFRLVQQLVADSSKFSDKDAKELLKDENLPDKVKSIGKKKLHLILTSNKFSREDIMKLLRDKKVVERLSFIDDNKFELINNSKKFNSGQFNSGSNKIIALLQDQKIVEHINFIDYEKLQFMLYDNKFLLHQVIALLKNQEVVDNIIALNIEKFRLIFYDDKLNCIDTIELLKNQKVVKCINLIFPEKLELIFNKFSFEDIKNLLENEQTAWNLRFAIPMLKAGKIYNIDLNYLSNNKNVHKDIIEYLYSNPSIELLIKHYDPNLNKDSFAKFSTFAKNIACEEPVSKLYNSSLEQVIENINPHKRARHS